VTESVSFQNHDKVGELGSKERYQLVNIFQDVEEICKNDVLRLLSLASEYTCVLLTEVNVCD